MKRAMSLEEERQALLEQIHSSRAAYRRMLAQYDEPGHNRQSSHGVAHVHVSQKVRGMPAAFPRSMTMRWILEHPYAVAGVAAGVVALLAIGPGRVARTVRSAPGLAPLTRKLQDRLGRAGSNNASITGNRVAPRSQFAGPPPVREVVVEKKASTTGAAIASVAGLASMVLRDPAKMRMVARAASAAGEWLRNRRAPPAHRPPATRGSQWQ